jgi:hypothetical protein
MGCPGIGQGRQKRRDESGRMKAEDFLRSFSFFFCLFFIPNDYFYFLVSMGERESSLRSERHGNFP